MPWPLNYYQGVRGLCDKYGMLLIADEVRASAFKVETCSLLPHAVCVPLMQSLGSNRGGQEDDMRLMAGLSE